MEFDEEKKAIKEEHDEELRYKRKYLREYQKVLLYATYIITIIIMKKRGQPLYKGQRVLSPVEIPLYP